MPEQNYPPFESGSLSNPRQLNRWLDKNPQGGALKRTSTYVVIPTFTSDVTWNGYSDIVLAYDSVSPYSISLKTIVKPNDANYALTVAYKVGDIVTRYLIWDADGSNLCQTINPYIGQPLPENFRFEIWNTSTGVASNATEITIYTSKKGSLDYRYGVDSALFTPSERSDFECNSISEQGLLPVITPFIGTLLNWFRADTGVTTNSWSPKVGTGYIATGLGGSSLSAPLQTAIKNKPAIPSNTLIGVGNGSPYDVWLMLKYVNDGTVFSVNTSTLELVGGTLVANGTVTNTGLSIGRWYVVRFAWYEDNMWVDVWDIQSEALIPKTPTVYSDTNDPTGSHVFTYNFPSCTYISDIIIYSVPMLSTDELTMLSYFQDRYVNLFSVPLTFPTNSNVP